ncbi:MAG: hypothetical protein KatS3mg023_3921 [Armatimonadota bacterium]|nr:MAG: hypothetical protein KatS3mg023_3921 [Armatimonadota bacterium]
MRKCSPTVRVKSRAGCSERMARGAVPIREKEFLQAVRELAELQGWLCYHTWNSLHSPAGFPDLVLVRPPRVLFVELKVGKREPTPAQREWLNLLARCAGVEAYLWKPEDWDEIAKILKPEPKGGGVHTPTTR